jgi:hypothetical protein
MLKINKKRLTLQHQQCFYFGFAPYSKKIICLAIKSKKKKPIKSPKKPQNNKKVLLVFTL